MSQNRYTCNYSIYDALDYEFSLMQIPLYSREMKILVLQGNILQPKLMFTI